MRFSYVQQVAGLLALAGGFWPVALRAQYPTPQAPPPVQARPDDYLSAFNPPAQQAGQVPALTAPDPLARLAATQTYGNQMNGGYPATGGYGAAGGYGASASGTSAGAGYGQKPGDALSDIQPAQSLAVFVDYDAFRGVSDGAWENNGINTGLNFGTRLGALSDWTGIGMQIGGSVGVYNWSGTDYRIANQDMAQTQGFITYGFFRNPTEDSGWCAAVVQDWMLNNNFSVFAENNVLSQWRAQMGYAVDPLNEIGLWGAWRAVSDTNNVNGFGPVTWRPIDMLNVYWHYKWGAGGADSWIWFGVPERTRLAGNGSLGDYVVGAFANCPLGERMALYTLVTYMHPSSSPGAEGAKEDQWNFTVGLAFYPARNARTKTVTTQGWLPRFPVANNGTFLVDASQYY